MQLLDVIFPPIKKERVSRVSKKQLIWYFITTSVLYYILCNSNTPKVTRCTRTLDQKHDRGKCFTTQNDKSKTCTREKWNKGLDARKKHLRRLKRNWQQVGESGGNESNGSWKGFNLESDNQNSTAPNYPSANYLDWSQDKEPKQRERLKNGEIVSTLLEFQKFQ